VIEYLNLNNGNDLPSLTGGVTMGVNALALNATKDYIVQRLEADKLKTILFAKGKNMDLKFQVDVSITLLQIEVTSTTSLSSNRLLLIKPSGEELLPQPTSQTPFIRMYTIPIERREIGEWTMISRMSNDHIIQLNAVSEISCTSILQKEIVDSSSNISFTPLTNQPVKQETNLFVLTICENLPSDLKTGYISLIDASDATNILETLLPIRTSPTGFLSKITIPDVDFRLSTIARLQDDTMVQRQEKEIISPTSISLTIHDQPYTAVLNDNLAMNYTIYNHGQLPLVITLRTTDTLSLLPISGVLKTYTIAGLSNFNDTVKVSTVGVSEMNSNSTVITDAIVFSITTGSYEYNQAVPLYIQRESVALTNQTDYQVPPPKANGVAKNFDRSTISFILFVAGVFLNFH
jgi:hypothetical protein